MVHGEFGFYFKCSGRLVRINENMEMIRSGLRDKRINLVEVSVGCGAGVNARKPGLKRKPQAQNGVTGAKALETKPTLNT